MSWVNLIVIAMTIMSIVDGAVYTVDVKRVNRERPVISSQDGSSKFTYNFNAAYLPIKQQDGSVRDGLLARCENEDDPNFPFNSVLGLTQLTTEHLDLNNIVFEPITSESVVMHPSMPYDSSATEDPRVVYRNLTGEYYLMYSGVVNHKTWVACHLILATAEDPTTFQAWQKDGIVFPEVSWSKSASVLIRDGFDGPHYMFWGDSTLVKGLQVATSTDLINWEFNSTIWLPVREDNFDSALVEGGPMPLMLSDGNYLYLYNSARHGFPSNHTGWDMQYNVGFLILDGNDPTKILQRSDQPIFSPELLWEKGDAPYLGQTPNVVFVEGWKALGNDQFLIFYGAADSVIGAAVVSVTISQYQ